MDLAERKRSIDISKLSVEQADLLSQQLGQMTRVICDEAVEKANKFLNIYGMKAQMQIVIMGINEDLKEKPAPKKRGRPKKKQT